MANNSVKVKGLNEVVRGFRKLNRTTSKTIQDGLKKDADPVLQDSKLKISRYAGAKVGSIRLRSSGASVYVRQNAKKVDGRHANFGSLQMRRMDEALEENRLGVERAIERRLDNLLDDF